MQVSITFDCESAAFFEASPMGEVRAVLDRAARYIESEPCGPNGFKRPLLDTNGNTVGHLRVTM